MQIIPVIDLKGGVVVRARMGQRDHYRPIDTPLSPTCRPVDVARGLLSIFPFTTLYVADLDAIEGRGDNTPAVAHLKSEFPDVTLWVDNGTADPQAAEAWLETGPDCLVIGSESLADTALVRRFADHPRIILSLDFLGQSFQGSPALLAEPAIWPSRVIAMTLARVGSGVGPDFDRLNDMRKRAGERLVYAAGGVRNAADLVMLERAGIAGALVASSLHDGRLGRSDIEKLSRIACANS